MNRTNPLPLSQYENKLQTIQEEYLLKHFQQIAIVLSTNYHYAFQIIKYLWKLQPNKRENAVRVIQKNVTRIIERRKIFVVGVLVRRDHERKYSKSKACIFITTFLSRKMVGLNVFIFKNIKEKIETKPHISKEKYLFLMIAFSNLNKLLSFTKMQALHMIKQQAIARTQQIRRAKLIKFVYNLNNFAKRLIIDSFLSIAHYSSELMDTYESQDSDDQTILIQSYKIMASNLNRFNFPKSNISLQQIKKESSISSLFRIIKRKYENWLRWSFMDIYCLETHRFKYQTIQVLKREIAILQQQYQQT